MPTWYCKAGTVKYCRWQRQKSNIWKVLWITSYHHSLVHVRTIDITRFSSAWTDPVGANRRGIGPIRCRVTCVIVMRYEFNFFVCECECMYAYTYAWMQYHVPCTPNRHTLDIRCLQLASLPAHLKGCTRAPCDSRVDEHPLDLSRITRLKKITHQNYEIPLRICCTIVVHGHPARRN